MRKPKVLFSLFLSAGFFLSPPVTAQEIEQSITRAINTHPAILASKSAEGAAHQTIIEENSAYYPTANVDASFGRIYSNTTTTRGLSVSRGAGYSWYGEGSMRVNQTLYDWNTRHHAVKAAKERYLAAGADYNSQVMNIAFQAAQAHIQLLRAQSLREMAESYVEKMRGYRERIQTAVKEGGADESQLSRANDVLMVSENLKIQYASDFEIAKALYKDVVGIEPEGDLVGPSVNISGLPATLEEALAIALSNNPLVESAHKEAMAAIFDVKREKQNDFPELGVEVSALKRDQKDLVGGEVEDARALLTANWSYNFGGASKAAQNRAELIAAEADYNAESMLRAIEKDTLVAWHDYKRAAAQKIKYADRLKNVEQTLSTFNQQYKGGQKKLLEVMNAENSVFRARQEFTNSNYEEMIGAYNLMAVTAMPFYKEDVLADGATRK